MNTPKPVYKAFVSGDKNYYIIGYYYDKEHAIKDTIKHQLEIFGDVIGNYKDNKYYKDVKEFFEKYKEKLSKDSTNINNETLEFLGNVEEIYFQDNSYVEYDDDIMELHQELAENVCEVDQIKIK